MSNYTQIQLRRDTSANWTSVNPVLAEGELAIDLTSKRIKVGDGVASWNNLNYSNDSEAVILVLTEGNSFVSTDLATIEYFPYNAVITELILAVSTAPSGSDLIVDLNKNNVSILTTKISINSGQTNSTTATTGYVLSSTTITKGDRISVDIDQVGATVRASNVQLIMNCVRV